MTATSPTLQPFVPRPQMCAAVALGIPQDRLDALVEHFEVYRTDYCNEVILDMTTIDSDRMDALRDALGFDPDLLGGGLVTLWAEPPQPLQAYAVLYRDEEQTFLDPPAMFRCYAEDCDHAEEQCLFAHPDATVVWIIHADDKEKDDVRLIETALEMDYRADTGGGDND